MADLNGFTPEMAADPNLPGDVIRQIAEQRPDLHAALAQNPALPADIRAWLQQSPDPQVQQTLASPMAAPNTGMNPMAGQPFPNPSPSEAPGAAWTGGADSFAASSPANYGAPVPPSAGPDYGSTPYASAPMNSPMGMSDPHAAFPAANYGAAGPNTGQWASNEMTASSGGGKGAKIAIISAIVVVALLVLGGLGMLIMRFSGGLGFGAQGAATPEELHQTVTKAISDKDLLTLSGMISPAEYAEYTKVKETVEANVQLSSSDEFVGPDALQDYMSNVTIENNKMKWEVVETQENLAVLQVTEWSADITVDPKLVDAMESRYEKAKGSKLNESEKKTFEEMRTSAEENNTHTGDLLKGSEGPRIVAVKENGRWYISGLMSFVENGGYNTAGATPDYAASFMEETGDESPEAAVQGLVDDALAGRNVGATITAIGKHLPLAERRVALVYGPVFSEVEGPAANGEIADISWDLKSNTYDGGAVVNLGNTTFSDPSSKNKVVFKDGTSVSVESGTEPVTIDFGRTLEDANRLGIFTVQEGGKWYVSSAGTFANLFALRAKEAELSKALDWFKTSFEENKSALGVPLTPGVDSEQLTYEEFEQYVKDAPALGAWITLGWDVAMQVQEISGAPLTGMGTTPGVGSTPSGDGFSNMNLDELDHTAACISDGKMASCDWLWSNGKSDVKDIGKTCGFRDFSAQGGTCEKDHGAVWKG